MDRRLAPRVYEGGDTSAHTGIGGSPSPEYLSQKSMKNRAGNTERLFYLTLFCQKFVLPPAPVCGLVPPPTLVRGARAAAPPALQNSNLSGNCAEPMCKFGIRRAAAPYFFTLHSSLFTIHYSLKSPPGGRGNRPFAY